MKAHEVRKLVECVAKRQPMTTKWVLNAGDTVAVVYPGTLSIVLISRGGMLSLEAKRNIMQALKLSGIERAFYPPTYLLHGYVPLYLRVVSATVGSVTLELI